MRVLLINSVCGIGSTGRICTDLAQKFEAEGNEVKIAYGRDGNVPEQFRKYAVRIGTDFDVRIHGVITRLFDAHGFGSYFATKKFLKWAEDYKPDLLWLHNIHGYYINIELLFKWIKTHPEMEVKWTLHDCWAFTGHCAYFTYNKCDGWRDGCGNCRYGREYPLAYLSASKKNFFNKKRNFTGVNNLTIVTPSHWLEKLVKESFLCEYNVIAIHNSISTAIFHPTESTFKKDHKIENKTMILGVASTWDKRKGLHDFIELNKLIDHNKYKIVLVGLNDQQIKILPKEIIGLKRTNSPQSLAKIYSAADIFLIPLAKIIIQL